MEGVNIVASALDNARWCDTVCRSHGLTGAFADGVWSCPRRTPRYYPDAVTLSGTATEEDVLDRIDTSAPGCSVKDSFAVLDLSSAGFDVLFTAEWIRRGPDAAPLRSERLEPHGLRWDVVDRPDALSKWETAWNGGVAGDGEAPVFRPALLADPAVRVLAGHRGGRIVAGGILHQSGSVIGLSNVFGRDGSEDQTWSGCLEVSAKLFPGIAVVGYEHGSGLAAACRNGFVGIGQLRVWMSR